MNEEFQDVFQITNFSTALYNISNNASQADDLIKALKPLCPKPNTSPSGILPNAFLELLSQKGFWNYTGQEKALLDKWFPSSGQLEWFPMDNGKELAVRICFSLHQALVMARPKNGSNPRRPVISCVIQPLKSPYLQFPIIAEAESGLHHATFFIVRPAPIEKQAESDLLATMSVQYVKPVS